MERCQQVQGGVEEKKGKEIEKAAAWNHLSERGKCERNVKLIPA